MAFEMQRPFIYEVSPPPHPHRLRHLSSTTLSKDEFFNDPQMNHWWEKPCPPPFVLVRMVPPSEEAPGVWSETYLFQRLRWRPPDNAASSSRVHALSFVVFRVRHNSYFHLHHCINYHITRVSGLQRCFPRREQRVGAPTKEGNSTYTRLALH